MDEQEVQRHRREQEEASTSSRSAILGLEYLDLRDSEETLPLARDVMTVKEMYFGRLVPLVDGGGDAVTEIGVTTQTPKSVMDDMMRDYSDNGRQIIFYLISNSAFRAMMRRFDPPKQVIYDDIEIANEGDSETIAKVSQTLESVGTEAVFDFLISQADKLGASDIHIENERQAIRVRMRVDGALHPVAELSRDRYRVLMGELARRANLSAAAKEPQSGHIQQEITRGGATHLLNMRIETVPTLYGQDAVLRLFNFDASLLQLDLLGIPAKQRAQINEIVSHPRGLVLMVGPTGSGKSTTLYSMLNALNSTERKIITLEDPIEYGLPGITQIPIDTSGGTSFADGLRSVLRLDPDVVMVGEIRDQDTARTAIQASITGHLVLSSFHATSTSAAFSRMIDMIGQNPIFASAIRLVIAQRLVRRLYDESKEAYLPDDATKNYLRRVITDLPDEYQEIKNANIDEIRLYRPVATETVPFGYQGRIVIMEQMVVDEEIARFMRGDVSAVDTNSIEKVAKARGMITLEQAGVLAVLRGETTLEEVERVI